MRDRRQHWFRGNGRKHANRRDDYRRARSTSGEFDSQRPVDGSTLTAVPDGSDAIVTGYYGGDGLRRKAMDLGFVPGASVQVLVRGAGRLLVVRVGETRIMIGHGVARHVRVLVKE